MVKVFGQLNFFILSPTCTLFLFLTWRIDDNYIKVFPSGCASDYSFVPVHRWGSLSVCLQYLSILLYVVIMHAPSIACSLRWRPSVTWKNGWVFCPAIRLLFAARCSSLLKRGAQSAPLTRLVVENSRAPSPCRISPLTYIFVHTATGPQQLQSSVKMESPTRLSQSRFFRFAKLR